MTRVVLSNGIMTDGECSLDLLGATLRRKGILALDVLLPNRTPVSAWWGAQRDGKALAQVSEPGDILVGHSFGCLRAAKAAAMVSYKRIFAIAPAMPEGYAWPDPTIVTCYHSRTDRALKAARLLIAHPFGGGGAGRHGFSDSRVTNIPCHGYDHSEYFEGELMDRIAEDIERAVNG